MKLAVLADIHGNLTALEAVFDDIQHRNVDGIITAGDLTRGPDDNSVIQLLQSLPGWVIRGNSDEDLLRLAAGHRPVAWYTLKQYAAVRWCLEQMTESSLDYLRSLPQQQMVALPGRDAIRVVHGSPRDPNELVYPEQDPAVLPAILTQVTEPVLVCGHTHLAWQRKMGDKLALNPGSVGLPVNGNPLAQYAILHWKMDGWVVEQCSINYDLDQIRSRFKDSGFLEGGGAFARALMFSAVSGKNVLVRFLRHTRHVAQQQGVTDLDAIPNEVWDLADKTFEWEVENAAETPAGPICK